jgi:beta-N-acetylhexosaminidase
LDLPWVRKTEAELQVCEWVPFMKAIEAGVEVIMTAHVMFPVLDPDYPATMSHRILTGLLRERFGYQGVIVSDDMEMKAVRGRYPVMEQMDVAVRAGVDAFLVCSDAALQEECIESLVKLQEQSVVHEERAEQSIQRLHHLQLQHQQMIQHPPLAYSLEDWMALSQNISEKSTPVLL